MKSADDFPHKRIAKIESTFLGYEDHGMFTAVLHVNYGSSAQGVGCRVLDGYDKAAGKRVPRAAAGAFISGVLKACNTDSWERLVGRTVFVLLEDSGWNAIPIGLAPLPTEGGEIFLFSSLPE